MYFLIFQQTETSSVILSICIRRKLTYVHYLHVVLNILSKRRILGMSWYVILLAILAIDCWLVACTCLISFWWFFWGSNTSETGRSKGPYCQVTCVLPVPGGPWITVQVVRKADFLSDPGAFHNTNQHNSQWFWPGWLHTVRWRVMSVKNAVLNTVSTHSALNRKNMSTFYKCCQPLRGNHIPPLRRKTGCWTTNSSFKTWVVLHEVPS